VGKDGKMKSLDKKRRDQYKTKIKEEFPETLEVGGQKFRKRLSLRYGENPGYPAAFYQEEEASGPNMGHLEILQEGIKGLSYINVADMDLGQRLTKKLNKIYREKMICTLIKHEMPSGVAMDTEPVKTFEKAWKCDSLSNFGSVIVFSYEIGKDLAGLLVESQRNVEVVYSPGQDNGLEFKRLAGGLLVQKRFDSKVISPDYLDVVSERKPTEEEIGAAIFNWIVAVYTRSNAVVIGTRDKVHGIGSGQRSRIDAAQNAIQFSSRGYGPEGCVMASDAFMPFPDVVELAAKNKITAIIYPLGSLKDQEVIDRADELNLAMIVTRKPGEIESERCFLHR